jgi:hypothetical protein
MTPLRLRRAGSAIVFLAWSAMIGPDAPASAFDWFPTDHEMQKFKQSWNPATHGPLLVSPADLQAHGRWLLWSFAYGELTTRRFGDSFAATGTGSRFYQDVITPGAVVFYGLTDHVSLGISAAMTSWSSDSLPAGSSSGRVNATGLDDIGLIVKTRHLVQDPDSWRPSVGTYGRISLPASRWTGTHEIPGGFVPITPRPITRAGALSFTEGALIRKNLEPFRLSSMVTYTYNAPGSENGRTVYPGDILDARVGLEYVASEKQGFGIIVDAVAQNGLPYRLDGHAINADVKTFSLIGTAVAVEYRFTPDWMASMGALFTLAGRNNVDAIYPGFSMKYYWGKE